MMDWEKLLNNNRLRQSKRKTSEDARNDFESDFGRIIFSPAIRRMHDKTQVFPLTTDDNIHSRLTHSMEVMSVGYSLGLKLCESKKLRGRFNNQSRDLYREIPIIIKNCCLIHDIGNPPFGHFGETVIQNYFTEFFAKNVIKSECEKFTDDDLKSNKYCIKLSPQEKDDFKQFDGNAQGLRIITKLQILNDVYGLNLTFATLASYIKYPNFEVINESKIASHKRGVFQSEKDYFQTISKECGLSIDESNKRHKRHPLCYLMEAADSICYLTMDIEDGFNKGIYDFEYIYNELKDIKSIKERIKEIYEDKDYEYQNEVTKMVNLRISLIQELVKLATKNFEENLEKIELGEYDEELIFDDNENELAKKLMDICKKKIFSFRAIVSLESTGYSTITGLLDYYIKFVFHKDKKFRKRAASLISNSIIKAAIEENMEEITLKRIDELEGKNGNSSEGSKVIDKIKEIKTTYNEWKKRREKLYSNECEDTKKIEKQLYRLNVNLKEVVNPTLDDLNDYFKLRIIVDFISGMTDQYALNHYQKLSGQKIN